MSDAKAPERIWAWQEDDADGVHKFWISNSDERTGEEAEYVRADLALSDPRVKAVVYASQVLAEGQRAGYYKDSPAFDDLHHALAALQEKPHG